MRKSDLINQISEKTGIPKVDVLVTLETMFKEVKESLSNVIGLLVALSLTFGFLYNCEFIFNFE